MVHSRLGVFHCIITCAASGYHIFQTWDQTWNQLFYARTEELDHNVLIHPSWPVFITVGYFISDLTYMFDYSQWFTHHVFAIIALMCSLLRPNLAMVSVNITLNHEVR